MLYLTAPPQGLRKSEEGVGSGEFGQNSIDPRGPRHGLGNPVPIAGAVIVS